MQSLKNVCKAKANKTKHVTRVPKEFEKKNLSELENYHNIP